MNGKELKYVIRKDTNCIKWDNLEHIFGQSDLLPLWVADMDFEVPDCVEKALKDYADSGVYGYTYVPDSYYEAFIGWEKQRHGFAAEKEWIRLAPGVVPALYWLVNALTKPEDAVIVLTPVYRPFMLSVTENGRKLVTSRLINESGVYSVDLADFEKKIREEQVKLFILCSPHNPAGRVWKREELDAMMDVCKKYGVTVLSDEIHHDLIQPGHKHIPTALTVDGDFPLVTLTAPSKTFNLAGLKNSLVMIQREDLRQAFDDVVTRFCLDDGICTPGVIAAEAAYRGGASWLEEVLDAVGNNYRLLTDSLNAALPKVVVSPLEGTYLAWLDFSAYMKPEEMKDFFQNKCGLALNYGEWFGEERGAFVRMNLATRKENVEEAVLRIVKALA